MDRTNSIVIDASQDPAKLVAAVQHGDAPLVRSLLGAKCNPNTVSDALGFPATPLIVSAAVGHTEIAKLLLEAGASVADAPHVGATALHAACGQGGNGELVDLLLSYGAEVRASPSCHRSQRRAAGAALSLAARALRSRVRCTGRRTRRHRLHAALLLVP